MSTVLYEKRGAVAIITLNRPEAMNAYDADAVKGMASCLREFDEDRNLRVAIFTGTGTQAFCSGADLKKLHGSEFHGGGTSCGMRIARHVSASASRRRSR